MTPLGSALQSTPLSASQREGRAFKALWSLCWGVFWCLFVWLHKEKSAASRCTNAGLCTDCSVTHTSTHPLLSVFSLQEHLFSSYYMCGTAHTFIYVLQVWTTTTFFTLFHFLPIQDPLSLCVSWFMSTRPTEYFRSCMCLQFQLQTHCAVTSTS